MEERILFSDRAEFRKWLFENHDKNQGIWLVLGKSGKLKTVSADEALEEALCFGWIDGLIKSVDDARYIKKFSPRRKGSNWSAKNKDTMIRLMAKGSVTEHGLKAVADAKKCGAWDVKQREPVLDSQVEILVKAIGGAEPALSNFLKMSPSVRRTYTGFYLDAKKEEVRINRLKKIVARLHENKGPMD
jgi:uncharacterized protein YdeI (YjbR/CyaY-like superfamily)